jgi:hypothetical protein
MRIEVQYGTAMVLIAFEQGININATVIRSRAIEKRQW